MNMLIKLWNLLLDLVTQWPGTPNPSNPPVDPTPTDPVDPIPVDPDNPPAPTPPQGKYDTDLLAEHNATRQKVNAKPLKINDVLRKAAVGHALWMATNDKMSHVGLNNSGPLDRAKDAGYRPNRIGENIAAGYKDVPSVMTGWRNSQGHYANIIGDYTEVGFGVVSRGTKLYWCSLFGKPASGVNSESIEVKISGGVCLATEETGNMPQRPASLNSQSDSFSINVI